MNVVIRAAFSPRLSALTGWIMQSSAQDALSLVRAASDPALGGGDYVGPSGYRQNTGPIRAAVSSEQSRDVVL
jgi:hypothetical protein